MLSKDELIRYNRHLILPGFGKEAQEKLKSSRVLVIGAGGLGCPVLQYLTAAGVGTIGILDFDVVDESNLQRQVLYNTEDIGKSKAETAAKKLALQNPHLIFKTYNLELSKDNSLEIIGSYDLIVDGSDNFATRYLVNDSCVIMKKPFVSGAIFKFEGQVSVFNYKNKDGIKGPTYRCLYPEAPDPKDVPSCSEIGVLGVLPGMIGAMQANETIKVITGIGEPLSGKLLTLDALTMQTNILKFSPDEKNFAIKELGQYEEVCEVAENEFKPGYKEMTVFELKEKLDQKENLELLDVREEFEREICSIGGRLIPMKTISLHIEAIPEDKPVIVYCHHGMRSAMVVKFLSEEFGYKNLYNLDGGIHAWALNIDKQMKQY
ncbi:MAG TPA: molybdopterin-synthase adenylyltransferase MoeB [Cytophagaceae bacterium]|nr:molybdopterin-synthase adenylyltransferase MoeB [Cytophagaceae bacterium]